MVGESAPSKDSPTLQVILDALDDSSCRAILREISEPMTANELINRCEIPKSTLYRKLALLTKASLVREQVSINPGGGRVTYYERDFDDVTITMDEADSFSVTVERPPKKADERLAHLWSKMGDEL